MSTFIYDLARAAFANAEIDWVDDDMRAILVDADYTPNAATDEFLDDIPGGGRLGSAVALGNQTNVGGVMDADDIEAASGFLAITGTPTGIVIYKHTGTEGTSRVVMHIDNASGLGSVLAAANVGVVWSSGANKIAKL